MGGERGRPRSSQLPAIEDEDLGTEDLPTSDATEEEAAELPGGERLYYRIGEVARIVGVDAHVLRYWESEFSLRPHRSGAGQRLYRKHDLARFLGIRRLLHDEGYTIAGARKILSGQPGPGTAADRARIREILDRLEGLRRQIQALRDEVDPAARR